ncbi:MAG: hypothetical protein KIS96_10850 [Bauldia sp.]|nr:hypothetical protein [Bauldia sp.]
MAKDSDLLREAREAFALAEDAEADNRREAEDDVRFGRLGEQWPAAIRAQREREQRPCLTINRLPAFMRQVINDARQNKPSIRVRPVDSGADIETAAILSGLIRNIESASNADVAYDTAAECAIAMGFGYWRIGLDYAHQDSFDLDISIDRVANPFAVYGDPYSTAADSADWNTAFVVELVPKALFKRLYPGAKATDWSGAGWAGVTEPWIDSGAVMVAEYWTREEVEREVLRLSDDTVIGADRLTGELAALVASGVVTIAATRKAKGWKVRQATLTAAEVLKSRDWPGQYIPIVPVYGDEVNLKGRRHFRSLIRDAKDPQRMHNFWRTAATEMTALAPRVPFIGPVGAFATDADKWATANRVSHAYIEYDVVPNAPGAAPQRLPLDGGAAAGAIQEALMASDDMKAVMGLHDASLGAPGNETSGRAIMARQREGDVSTFHFIDNVSRAIRHTGRILIDLIPRVYDSPRIVRILGEDGVTRTQPVNQPVPVTDPATGAPLTERDPATGLTVPVTRIHDLAAGRYDLTVSAGPSFTSRREEAAFSMAETLRAFPEAAPIIVPELARNLDWPGADAIARKLDALAPKAPEEGAGGGIPPELQAQIAAGLQQIEALTMENARLRAGEALDGARLELEREKLRLEATKLQVEQAEVAARAMAAGMG